MVRHQPSKLIFAGSNPVSRSTEYIHGSRRGMIFESRPPLTLLIPPNRRDFNIHGSHRGMIFESRLPLNRVYSRVPSRDGIRIPSPALFEISPTWRDFLYPAQPSIFAGSFLLPSPPGRRAGDEGVPLYANTRDQTARLLESDRFSC